MERDDSSFSPSFITCWATCYFTAFPVLRSSFILFDDYVALFILLGLGLYGFGFLNIYKQWQLILYFLERRDRMSFFEILKFFGIGGRFVVYLTLSASSIVALLFLYALWKPGTALCKVSITCQGWVYAGDYYIDIVDGVEKVKAHSGVEFSIIAELSETPGGFLCGGEIVPKIFIQPSNSFEAQSNVPSPIQLGSGLIDHIQKMTMAAIAIADMKVWAQRSYRV